MRTPRVLMCPRIIMGFEYEINPWMDRRVKPDNPDREPAMANAPGYPSGTWRPD